MTKLLVLSDSHGGRTAIERVLMKESKNIDALIFLGDGLRDLELALTLYPKLRAYSVAGNCDYGALEPTDGLAAFAVDAGDDFLVRFADEHHLRNFDRIFVRNAQPVDKLALNSIRFQCAGNIRSAAMHNNRV